MKTKYIVIGCLALVVLVGVVIAGVVGGIFYLGLNKEIDKTETEGVAVGRRTDQQGCLDEGLRRLRATTRAGNPITRHISELFLNGCFQSCRETAGFCRDVPKEDAFFTVRKWAQDRCQQVGAGTDDACVSLFIEVSNACLGKIKHQ
jgi:hypothetical protein